MEVLEDTVDTTENYNGYVEDHLILQQNRAFPHFPEVVRQYLNEKFPTQWIEERGFIELSSRSTYPSPLDYFLL